MYMLIWSTVSSPADIICTWTSIVIMMPFIYQQIPSARSALLYRFRSIKQPCVEAYGRHLGSKDGVGGGTEFWVILHSVPLPSQRL